MSTCSLIQSKLLKSLDVRCNSYLIYDGVFYSGNSSRTPDFYELHTPTGCRTSGYSYGCGIPAYSSSELGDMLPDYVSTIRKNEEGSPWWCDYEVMVGEHKGMIYSWGATEASARAEMLIQMLQFDIIDVYDVNKGKLNG